MTRRFRYLWLVIGVVCLTLAVDVRDAFADEPLQYNRDIRPLLSEYCLHCHGPSEAGRKADLRLDDRGVAIDMNAITPGKPDESEMLRRIFSDDPHEIMPPPESKKTLKPADKEKLKRWIAEGAAYAKHWSFLTPAKPMLPAVKQADWCRNPIDRFVLARQESQGLKPAPEADRPTLIRRVSFDVTGLPPTLAELDRFEAGDAADWYEQMVDYYLAKPAYGERMALAWMDASRYGDTSVFHADGPRDMWPWRNWVINAYNSNKPFSEFTIEQLAGDLLPEATPLQQLASGFNRNHATTDEGGAIAEEWRVDYVVDRVQTTSNVWLGISMECSQCHDHKYDPVTQKEYYGFFAFFNQTTDPGMQSRKGNQKPIVNVPDEERDRKIAAMQAEIQQVNKQIDAHTKAVEEPFQKWLAEASRKSAAGEQVNLPDDAAVHFALDETAGKQAVDRVDAKRKGKVVGDVLWKPGHDAGAFEVNTRNFIELGNVGDFERDAGFSYGCWVKPAGNPTGVPIGKMDEGNAHRGWDLYVVNGQVSVHIINSWPSNAIKVTTKAKIPKDKWSHVFATYDGSSKAAGVKIFFDGKPQEWSIEQNGLSASIRTKVPAKIGRRNNSSGFRGLVDDVRLYQRQLTEVEVAALASSDGITPLLTIAADKRTPAQTQALRGYFLANIDAETKKFNQQKQKLSSQISTLEKQVVTSMIMGEQDKPRPTYLLMRGHYASPDKSAAIPPSVPAIFPGLPEGAPANRLGLARWLVDESHPLTARVTVNRYWSMLFGRGIVSTPMDFGSQGAWPSHPELLDWLAVDFRESGWDIKRALKQMLTSATYRQSSRLTRELAEADPQNLWLARAPRLRLPGEHIRDAALASSGLLVDQVGGPGVKPYQPPGLWNEVSLSGNVRFVADKGEKLYRKSLYIYWKRSSPHPGMRIFDAPTREKCVVQRPRTNTPLQALYTLNDTQFVEAARHLAERMMTDGGPTPDERIRWGYRVVASRPASAPTVAKLVALYEQELAKYQQTTTAAKELLAIGDSPRNEKLDTAEHAAWTVVANVLLNLDATLTKY